MALVPSDVEESPPEAEPERPHDRRLSEPFSEAALERFAETVDRLTRIGHLPLAMAWRIASALLEGETPRAPVRLAHAETPLPTAPLTRRCSWCRREKLYPDGYRSRSYAHRVNARVCTDCTLGLPPSGPESPPDPIPVCKRCTFCGESKPYPEAFRQAGRPGAPPNKRKCTACGMAGKTQVDEDDEAPEPRPLSRFCLCGVTERRHEVDAGACVAFRARAPAGPTCPIDVRGARCGWPLAPGGAMCAGHERRRDHGYDTPMHGEGEDHA